MKRFTLISMLILTMQNGYSQTFHGIIFANTDANIGKAIKKNSENVSALCKEIATNLNYQLKLYHFDGDKYNYESLDSLLLHFKANPDDVIFYYLSSHGIRGHKGDSFPRISIPFKGKSKYYSSSKINERLTINNKHAKSVTVIIQACNKKIVEVPDVVIPSTLYQSISFLTTDKPEDKLYEELFVNNKNIFITSSQPGKTSSNTKTGGSHFTRALTETMPKYFSNNTGSISWQDLMKKVIKRYIEIQDYHNTKKKNRRFPVWTVKDL